MNTLYAKTILYSYGCLEEMIEQIDDLVIKKALNSMDNFKPCVVQCEAIINLTEQKDRIIQLKLVCDQILHKFNEQELDCLDYKYFKKKPKEYYTDFDFYSRAYFRKQVRLAKKFAFHLEKAQITDQVFEKNYLEIDFYRELFKRVKSQEENAPNKRRFLIGASQTNSKNDKRDALKKEMDSKKLKDKKGIILDKTNEQIKKETLSF